MKQINGNLLDMFDNGDFDVIIHGCNCQCAMDGGIAYQIAQRYPMVQQQDNNTEEGSHLKLGTIDPVWMSSRMLRWFRTPRMIINAYTQYRPGADANIYAITHAFANLSLDADKLKIRKARIGIPAIGCGIGGLTWEEVELVIERTCGHLDITLVVFE